MPYNPVGFGTPHAATGGSGGGSGYQPVDTSQFKVSYKPASQPKQVFKAQPKQQSGIQKVGNFFKSTGSFLNRNVVQPTVTTGEKTLNTAEAGQAGLFGGAKVAGQLLTGNKKGAEKTAANSTRVINQKLSKGAGGKGGYISPKQAATRGGGIKAVKQNVKSIVQGASDIAPLVVPFGKAAEGASLLSKVGQGAVKNAAVGGGSAAANAAVNGNLISKEGAKQTLRGIVQGAALGAGGELLHAGIKAGKESIPTEAKVRNLKTNAVLDKNRLYEKPKSVMYSNNGEVLPEVKTHDLLAQAEQARGEQAQKIAREATQPPDTRPPEVIKEAVKQNSDHVKTLTGKNPNAFLKTDATGKQTIAKDTPADVKPYIQQHQSLQKEYTAATSPKAELAKTTPITKIEKQNAPTPVAKIEKSTTSRPSNVITLQDEMGDNHHYQLSGDALKEYQQLKSNYDKRVASLSNLRDREFAQKQLKAEAMQFSAAKRRITGQLTARERGSILNKERSAYVGKNIELNINGKTVKGKISSTPAFGNVKVTLEDGTVVSVKHGELPEDRRSSQEILASHIRKGVKEYSPKEQNNISTVVRGNPKPQPEQTANTKSVQNREPPVSNAVEQPKQTGAERGTSKVAQSVQEKAVSRGLKNDFGEAGGYDKITIADQAKRATDVTKDPARVDRIINGQEKLPDGLRATAFIKAVEEHPTLGKNPDVISRLSQAEHLTGESSRSAQEMRLAAERHPTSPVESLNRLRQNRTKAFEKRTGKTADKAVNEEVKKYQTTKPKVTRETWGSFIDGLKC